MQAHLETLSALERRLTIAIPFAAIEQQVQVRLQKISRTAKIQGFRPGKAPLKIIAQQYGYQVRDEVLNDAVNQTFGNAVQENKLRVAGSPRFENADNTNTPEAISFNATFEVYPEVQIASLAGVALEAPTLTVGDEEVAQTLEILRKQRTRFEHVERAAVTGDRVIVDFVGTLDGVAFAGGSAQNQAMSIGEGQYLPEFETAAIGLSADESRTFDLTFPEDYQGKEVAGKTAQFTITVKQIAEPTLPAVDAEFAKMLGIADGDTVRMLEEVKVNVEREVSRRLKARTKENVMNALLGIASLELPKALVANEIGRLAEQAKQEFSSRGMDVKNMPFPPDAFEEQAKRRVALGLILAELVEQQNLQAQPEQVRAIIEDAAASYEQPAEVVRWYYAEAGRLDSAKAAALEENVVAWALAQADTSTKTVSFNDLMGNA